MKIGDQPSVPNLFTDGQNGSDRVHGPGGQERPDDGKVEEKRAKRLINTGKMMNKKSFYIGLGLLLIDLLFLEVALNGNENLGNHLTVIAIYGFGFSRIIMAIVHWHKEHKEFNYSPHWMHSIIALAVPWLTLLAEPLQGKARYYFDIVCFFLFYIVILGMIIFAFSISLG